MCKRLSAARVRPGLRSAAFVLQAAKGTTLGAMWKALTWVVRRALSWLSVQPQDDLELTHGQLFLMAVHRVDAAEDRIGKAYEWYRDRRLTFAKGVFGAGSLVATAFVAFLFKLPFDEQKGAVNVAPLIFLGVAVMVAAVVLGSMLWSRLRPVTREYIDAVNFYTAWKRWFE